MAVYGNELSMVRLSKLLEHNADRHTDRETDGQTDVTEIPRRLCGWLNVTEMQIKF